MVLLSGIPNLALIKPRGHCLKYILFQLHYLCKFFMKLLEFKDSKEQENDF